MPRRPAPRSATLAVIAVAALAAPAILAPPAALAATIPSPTEELQEAVTVERIQAHLDTFQEIADDNDGNRASGQPGYDASAEYVYDTLTAAGYDVEYQDFEFEAFTELSPPSFARVSPEAETFVEDEDFATAQFSGSGTVESTAQYVDVLVPPPAEPGSTSGCEAADFASFTAGNIALLQRGTCTFEVKARNAQEAGAAAAIVFNEGQEGRTDLVGATLTNQVDIPVITTSFAVGSALDAATVQITTETESATKTTRNVITQTQAGNNNNVIMVGAHLDSIPDGPGYNDNGSGSAAILEVALQLAEFEPVNMVRFAWWGAEEAGRVGSTYYVDQLTDSQLPDIAIYLNFDMVASPNYIRGVYDGDGSSFDQPGPVGSAVIENVFNAYFTEAGLPFEATALSGRTDYAAFIANDIPAGGLFTGAEEIKTPEQVERYGGVAGVAADPCYHEACDSSTPVEDGADAEVYDGLDDLDGNVNTKALDTNADAIAHAVATYAYGAQG